MILLQSTRMHFPTHLSPRPQANLLQPAGLEMLWMTSPIIPNQHSQLCQTMGMIVQHVLKAPGWGKAILVPSILADCTCFSPDVVGVCVFVTWRSESAPPTALSVMACLCARTHSCISNSLCMFCHSPSLFRMLMNVLTDRG